MLEPLEIEMATWATLAADAPMIAAEGARLLSQHGPSLAFLATVRADGGPRIHPICPKIVAGGLYAFIAPSPKANDLLRNGHFALHAFLGAASDDEFYLTGAVIRRDDPTLRAAVRATCEWDVADAEILFEFDIKRVLLAIYKFRGDFPPTYTRWRDPASTPG